MTERRVEILADFHLTILRIAYPEFRFTAEMGRAGRSRWVAVRRSLAPGLHAVVTDDLDDLIAALGPPDLSYEPANRDLAEVVILCSLN